jgi:CheY-like chemotaxis protein
MNNFEHNGSPDRKPDSQTNVMSDHASAEDSTSLAASVPVGNGKRILLVDDDPAWVWICQKILSGLGYKVTGYTCPVEALNFFRIQPRLCDLVITDLNMPVLDGVTLCTKLLDLRSDLPVILMTCGDGTISPDEVEHEGFRELLLKPTLANMLERTVQEVLATLRDDMEQENH